MKIRKITSLTASLAFGLMVLTSIVLYIVPQGRVAYWADWRLWGLTKTEWGNLHINLGLLFLIALLLHVYYNWKPLMSYLRNKARQMKVFTPEFNLALAMTVVLIVGTYLLLPPFSWVMALNDHFKHAGAQKYGEPPYGHAELSSLQTFCGKLNLDLAKSMEMLEKAGYTVESADVTLATIARRHGVAPQQLYLTIQPARITNAPPTTAAGGGLPDAPPPGSGNLTLADFCTRFNLNLPTVVQALTQRGIAASAERTLKNIAVDNQTSPSDIYEHIRRIASK